MTSFYPGHANATQVGTYFVCQYYQILQQQPDSVHQFYTNLSSMVRSDGAATESAQGMLQIHNLVMCLNFNGIEIKTAHFLESWNGGVLVMVSGYVQLKEYSIRRKFVQTFFLAPQEKGYFVLNDIFHFLEEEHVHQLPESVLDHGDFETKQDATNSLPEPEENDSSDNNTIDEVPQEFPVCDEREDETPPEERTMTHPNAINNLRDLSPTAEEPVAEAGRQTYASILQAKGQAGPHPTSLTKNSLVAPDRHHKPPPTTQQLRSALVTEKSSSMSLDEALLVEDEGEERSVYVGNLPSSISTSDLEQEFKNFGRLKPDGVSIRSRKEAGVFYAFIEYEDATGVQNALKASPIQLNGRLIHVEERRPNGGASRGSKQYVNVLGPKVTTEIYSLRIARIGKQDVTALLFSAGRSRGRGGYQSEVPRGRFGGRSFGRVVAQEIGDKDYNSRLRGNGNLQRGPRQQRGILGSQAPRNGHNPAEALAQHHHRHRHSSSPPRISRTPFPLVTITLTILLPAVAGDLCTLVYKGCANQTLSGSGAAYMQPLAALSSALTARAAAAKFYKTTTSSAVGGQPLFGLFQCRGDLSPSDCSACVGCVLPMWTSLCGPAAAARVQLNGCYALYQVSGFPQVSGTQMLYKACGSGGGGGGFEVKRDTAFAQLQSGVAGGQGFYATSYASVYAMAQCEGDLSAGDCSECIAQAVQKSEVECGGAASGQVYLDKCYISYSYYANGVPHGGGGGGGVGGGGGGGGEKTVAIVVGGAAGVGFLVICLLFARSVMKKKDGKCL
ncbi:unnamed protein product [Musa acuminata subsp. burmannicoides]